MYLNIFMSLKWWVILMTIFCAVLPQQQVHYDCYGSGLMNANCSDSEQIQAISVEVGTKPKSLGCPLEYSPDLNLTAENFTNCCKPEVTDVCKGTYENVNTPALSFTVFEFCMGRSVCRVTQVTRMDTLHLNCSQTVYNQQTTYMTLSYNCIDKTLIGTINTPVSIQSENPARRTIYLQGQKYEDNVGISHLITSASCSVEASNCSIAIVIDALDMRLATSGGNCQQTIQISDGPDYQFRNLSCDLNTNFTYISNIMTTETNYINIMVINNRSTGGYFWLGFTSTSPDGTLELSCPPKSSVLNCPLPTTTTDLQTTELETTTSYSTEQTTADTTEQDTTTGSESTTEPDATSVDTTVDVNTTDETTSGLNTTVETADPGGGKETSESNLGLIVGVVCGLLFLVLVFLIVGILVWKKYRKKPDVSKAPLQEAENHVPAFDESTDVENSTPPLNTSEAIPAPTVSPCSNGIINGMVPMTEHVIHLPPIPADTTKRKKKKKDKRKKKKKDEHDSDVVNNLEYILESKPDVFTTEDSINADTRNNLNEENLQSLAPETASTLDETTHTHKKKKKKHKRDRHADDYRPTQKPEEEEGKATSGPNEVTMKDEPEQIDKDGEEIIEQGHRKKKKKHKKKKRLNVVDVERQNMVNDVKANNEENMENI